MGIPVSGAADARKRHDRRVRSPVVEPVHRRIAEIALRAAGDLGLALAGGYAVSAHGIGNRPSGDVDLFTDWQRRADFPTAADLVIEALEANGYTVAVDKRSDTFARLQVSTGTTDATEKVELAADWRSHPPVTLDIGPVLHPDDAVANKMAALYGRALPRDFLDIDAVLQSGRYTREDLLRLAEARHATVGGDRRETRRQRPQLAVGREREGLRSHDRRRPAERRRAHDHRVQADYEEPQPGGVGLAVQALVVERGLLMDLLAEDLVS